MCHFKTHDAVAGVDDTVSTWGDVVVAAARACPSGKAAKEQGWVISMEHAVGSNSFKKKAVWGRTRVAALEGELVVGPVTVTVEGCEGAKE